MIAAFALALALSASPSTTARTVDGAQIKSSDLKGKVTVVAFWATWCAPCLKELPTLSGLPAETRVLAVAVDDASTASRIPSFAKRLAVTFPIIHDASGELRNKLAPGSDVPFTVVIDKRGRIAWTHAGYREGDGAALASVVRALQAEP
jgi:thiol-disulfide isomerase/thioredoxin